MSVHRSTLAEQETVYRWDREELTLHAWTANASEAQRWRRRGWNVQVRGTVGGVPRSWEVKGHLDPDALLPRKVNRDGHVIRRKTTLSGAAAIAAASKKGDSR